jgi:hypothetical protein
METFVGLDVSLKQTSGCTLDQEGAIEDKTGIKRE